MFGHKLSKKAYKIKKLFHEPFKYWPDATAAFLRHESSTCGMHADTMTICVHCKVIFLDKLCQLTF